MIELREQTRRVSGSRLLEICEAHGIRSLVDPFMGIPSHLNYLKRHGIVVHGGDVLDWFVRAGEGLIVNDLTLLRDDEVAALVERAPGRVYPVGMFRAWDGVFFSEEQCQYLAVWHTNVHELRSDGQTGLAIAGLWHVLCYWLLKSHAPDELPDIPPSELAWKYLREAQRLVCGNNARNTVRRADFRATLAAVRADAVFLSPPGRNAAAEVDARIWMWEAWWQGNPYFSVELAYRDTIFGRRTRDDASYDLAIAGVLEAAHEFPFVIVPAALRDRARLENVLRRAGRTTTAVEPAPDECYLIAER